MARKASGSAEDAGGASETAREAGDRTGGDESGPASEFEGAYAEYFRSVCRGQRAQQVEMQRVWCEYVKAAQASIVTHDSDGLLRAQQTFQEDWGRVADPGRFQESVREAFDGYQKKIVQAFAGADLPGLSPGDLEAIGRSVSYVASHRMGAGG